MRMHPEGFVRQDRGPYRFDRWQWPELDEQVAQPRRHPLAVSQVQPRRDADG
jgi:hypothetical protein